MVDFDTVAAPPGQGAGLTLVGTPGHAAPEQLMGETSTASDVFGMGSTMLFAALGRAPETLERKGGRYVLEGHLAGLSAARREALDGMLQPSLNKLFESAADVLRALHPPAVVARQTPSRAPAKGKGNRTLVIGIAVAVVLAGGAAWFVLGARGAAPTSHEQLLQAGIAAIAAGDVAAYEALFVSIDALERACPDAPPSQLAHAKKRLSRNKGRVGKKIAQCTSRFGIGTGEQLALVPGAALPPEPSCPVLERYHDAVVSYLVSVSKDESVKLWSVASGALQVELSPHAGKVYAVDWQDSGALILTAGKDETLRLWNGP